MRVRSAIEWRAVVDSRVDFVIVGVPTERKPGENRVALTPDGARELTTHGHRVLVETGAGAGSAIADDDFAAAGAELVRDAPTPGVRISCSR